MESMSKTTIVNFKESATPENRNLFLFIINPPNEIVKYRLVKRK
jgi:hypothetical protein